jgi:hypothetical protein
MKRLFKPQARKAYDNGTVVLMVPCRIIPNNTWGMTFTLDRKDREAQGKETDFDKLAQEFAWYNCVHETGYYPAFYTQG